MASFKNSMSSARILVIGLVVVLVVFRIGNGGLLARACRYGTTSQRPVNALANSSDKCVSCHRNSTPGIVDQYGHSTMAAAKVECADCHEVDAQYPGAIAHEGTYISPHRHLQSASPVIKRKLPSLTRAAMRSRPGWLLPDRRTFHPT